MPDPNPDNSTQAKLKKRYTDDLRIERLLYPKKPLSIETCYIELAIVQEKLAEKITAKPEEESTDLDRHYWLRSYERIENIQEKIELEGIFTACQGTPSKDSPKRIYIEGAAGSGKSTLSRRLAYGWAKQDSFFDDYDYVFQLRLRDLTTKEYAEDKDGIIELIAEHLLLGSSKQQQKTYKEKLTEAVFDKPSSVLWILDGYDELPSEIESCSWWKDLMYSGCDILITSRPGHHIPNNFNINLRLAVLGFSDQQIEKYISHFFNPEITPEINPEEKTIFLAYLKNDLNLWSLAHTPIQLELLCSVWNQGLKEQENVTITSLYQLILEQLLKRPQAKIPQTGIIHDDLA